MKKLLLISFLIASFGAYSQMNWSNYSTSFGEQGEHPSLGVAIPYNGIYDNFDKNIAGISHWNPQYKLNIDTTLNEKTPLFFVYDTSGIYFLVPGVNEKNAGDFEFTVLLNNKTTITPWSPVRTFTREAIGEIEAGTGITDSYRAGIGQYLVAHLRNRQGQILSSRIIYFKKRLPVIKSLSTSDNARAFSGLLNNKNAFSDPQPDMGWHRRYTAPLPGDTGQLKLSYNENNLLININAGIYKKEALEYMLLKGGKELRKWGSNEYDDNYILLKELPPGTYTLLIRLRRQQDSITGLHFSIASIWYKTVVFKAVIFVFLVLAAAFFALVKKYRNQKQALKSLSGKAEQSAEELKNIHALLNPHFTFNALSSIQALINKGAVDAAGNYLSSFGALLRETLKESKTDLIPITKELKNLEIYIGLEQLRQAFTYDLTIDPDIDLYTLTIPPFLLQPFVENSIKHGFSKMNGQGALKICIRKDRDTLLVQITDNGPGFDSSSFKEGYGLGLSAKRIQLLNNSYGEELIRLQLENTGKGTLILISFKNWL